MSGSIDRQEDLVGQESIQYVFFSDIDQYLYGNRLASAGSAGSSLTCRPHESRQAKAMSSAGTFVSVRIKMSGSSAST
jgi:hypothetical protein